MDACSKQVFERLLLPDRWLALHGLVHWPLCNKKQLAFGI